MKFTCETVMILWHDKDPIYSLDFDSSSNRLCTTGSDNDIKIWSYQKNEKGGVEFSFLSSLSKHSKHVNVARFSPGGNLLASGSDDGTVVIWRLSPNHINTAAAAATASTPETSTTSTSTTTTTQSSIDLNGDNDSSNNKETWTAISVLRVPTDSYDLSWSPNGLNLTTCSTDHTFQIWNPITRNCIQTIEEHTHYVQGVCWDPLGRFLLTESADGSCRLYENNNTEKTTTTTTKKKKQSKKQFVQLKNVLSKRVFTEGTTSTETSNNNNNNNNNNNIDNNNNEITTETSNHEHRMYYDECVSSRPSWSPDGSLFITPTGQFKSSPNEKVRSTSYLFSRSIPNKPIIHLPSNKPSLTVKFNPIIYRLDKDKTSQLSDINYKMIFAIATSETIILYDTQSLQPILVISDIHYAPITDMCWTHDGSILMVTSQDGFCSYLAFQPNELGIPLEEENWPESMKEAKQLRLDAYQNTLFEKITQQQLHQQQKQQQQQESLKRKIDSDSTNNTTTNDNDEQVEKKQKTDDSTTTTTTTTTTTSSSTETLLPNGKPKRRLQATLISK
ncbi:hypothetical protein PPL_09092 [Heterostelium album PN500]|uniref:CAF1B/HIR1 beta-propeller domain-containing protein n=1 Tax=Heterostelium pallidum (strain ATCC 26659 / Pp 5 / PN500) TaxID=670386 RepID=D3BKL0_HETP5|nr:hypothetical protein PPL_09092 [Heterostelium album PN500]EFA78440.1 hypothetical protein PPL_09092 [Heterostelium album PN500]|eukprot:XP_020430565.1 hypothetical protein PPL_09092 [Heterostelium album PN500]